MSAADVVIVAVYLVFVLWWGFRHGKSADSQSYFLAGRSMSWRVVGLSLFAASISSTTLIGQSGDAYDTGLAVYNYNLTGMVVMVCTGCSISIPMSEGPNPILMSMHSRNSSRRK